MVLKYFKFSSWNLVIYKTLQVYASEKICKIYRCVSQQFGYRKSLANSFKRKKNIVTFENKDSEDTLVLNKNVIISKYVKAFKLLKKRTSDTSFIPCISCEKLWCKRNVTSFEILESKKFDSQQIWNRLMDHYKSLISETLFVCMFCYQKLSKSVMPSTCILINLEVKSVPDEIKCLNEYEKMLIQRAKAFQVVQKLDTISKKNLAHRHKVSKVKGRTFHLPLPLD